MCSGIPLGHLINRPPSKGFPNVKLTYKKTLGLLYVVAKKKIDATKVIGGWEELYLAYNDNKV
jgi:hypothetical protein